MRSCAMRRFTTGPRIVPIVTDLGVVGDRIALIGSLEGTATRTASVRRCRSRARARVFIDVHSHSDELWLADRRCSGKILQGVTTEVGGKLRNLGRAARGRGARGARSLSTTHLGIDVGWHDFDGLLRRGRPVRSRPQRRLARRPRHDAALRPRRPSGDRSTRASSRPNGCSFERPSNTARSASSSGLIYVPSRYADETELGRLRDRSAARGRRTLRDPTCATKATTSSPRSRRRSPSAGGAEVAVQCSHHKAAGKKNWGKVHRSLAVVDRERARGFPVAVDAYPYVASWTELSTLLPEDALAGGKGRDDRSHPRPRDGPSRSRCGSNSTTAAPGMTSLLTTRRDPKRTPALTGYRIDEIAAYWRCSPARGRPAPRRGRRTRGRSDLLHDERG